MKFWKNTKRIFTVALAVWLSGIVLVLCCNVPMAQAETIVCPLAKKSNCAKSSEKDLRKSFIAESPILDCCAYSVQIFDKARKIEFQPQTAEVVETVKIAAPTEKESCPHKTGRV